MVPFAHASDGGGSIRIPASCCGLVGLKPSQGRITLGPFRDESNLGVELCVSRTVRDTAALLDAVHGPGVGDTVIAPPPARPYVDEVGADPGRLRIGLLDATRSARRCTTTAATPLARAAALLESLGHHVEPGFPAALANRDFGRRFSALWSTNMGVVGAAHRGPTRPRGRRRRPRAGQPGSGRVRPQRQRRRLRARARRNRRVPPGRAAVVGRRLGPAADTDARRAAAAARHVRQRRRAPMAPMLRAAAFVPFTPPFNSSGQPAISLPLHWNDAGLPIGVQLVAAYGREDVLLRVAAQLELAQPWARSATRPSDPSPRWFRGARIPVV